MCTCAACHLSEDFTPRSRGPTVLRTFILRMTGLHLLKASQTDWRNQRVVSGWTPIGGWGSTKDTVGQLGSLQWASHTRRAGSDGRVGPAPRVGSVGLTGGGLRTSTSNVSSGEAAAASLGTTLWKPQDETHCTGLISSPSCGYVRSVQNTRSSTYSQMIQNTNVQKRAMKQM